MRLPKVRRTRSPSTGMTENRIIHSIATVLLVVPIFGCGTENMPDWMSTEDVEPVIPSSESGQLPPPPLEEPPAEDGGDVDPLALEDLMKRTAGGDGRKADAAADPDTRSATMETKGDEWSGNLKLPPLNGGGKPVENATPNNTDNDSETESRTPESGSESVEKKTTGPPDENDRERPGKPERVRSGAGDAGGGHTSRRSDLRDAIARASGGGRGVPYKVIQKKIAQMGKWETVSEKSDTDTKPATDAVDEDGGVDEKKSPDPVKDGGGDIALNTGDGAPPVGPLAKDEGPMPVPVPAGRSKPAGLAMGEEVVVSGGAVQVNDRFLNADQLLDGMHERFLELPRDLPQLEFRKKALEIVGSEIHYQIQQSLVFAEAERRLKEQVIDFIQADVDKEIRRMIAEAGGSREALEDKCRREGITLGGMERSLSRDYIVSTYLQQKFYPRIVVNRRTLWNYYRKHKDEFSSDKKVKMQIIAAHFNRFEPLKSFYEKAEKPSDTPSEIERTAAEKAAREHIEKALAALKNGTSFSAVAKEFSTGPMRSNGGVWGLMGRGNKREEQVEAKAFELAEGEASGIIRDAGGFFIVKALEVKEGESRGFVEAQDDIAEKLRKEQYGLLRDKYFSNIYEGATVKVGGDFIKRVVDRAVERYWYFD